MREFIITITQQKDRIRWCVSEYFGEGETKAVCSGANLRHDMDYMVFMTNVVNSCIDRVYAVDNLSKFEIVFLRG